MAAERGDAMRLMEQTGANRARSVNKDLSATDRCFEGCGVRFERRQDRKRFF